MADAPQGSIVYTRDQLMNLRLCGGTGRRPKIPRELKRKYWGCRAGRRRQLRKRRFLLYLPSIIMGNVWSLVNKMDELTSLTKSESVFREVSVMCFMAVWQHTGHYNEWLAFSWCGRTGVPMKAARRKEGELLFTWTTGHITVKNTCATRTLKCAVSLRPYYLQRGHHDCCLQSSRG